MKYINAERLKAEVNDIKESGCASPISVCNDILSFIDYLQQDQPMPDSTKLIELWHEDKEMLKEKDFRNDPWRLAFNAFLCGFGRGIAVNKQEQPEVDLAEEIARFFSKNAIPYEHLTDWPLLKNTALYFYELGLNAKKRT